MYLDSCVLAKLLVAEPDSEACEKKISGTVLVSSELAYGEIFSMLLRKERGKEISAGQREAAWKEFERLIADQSIYLAVLDGVIVRKAKEVMQDVHPHVPLRTLDAIHLATFLSILGGPLFTTDRRLKDAARLLEIPLVE
ncbi:MAG: PIN domain-containing protein [Opitutus sp.]|nr:PIN domain-containing protein [Opitutus sp.]